MKFCFPPRREKRTRLLSRQKAVLCRPRFQFSPRSLFRTFQIISMDWLLNSEDLRFYSSDFELNIWFRARKVNEAFEKLACERPECPGQSSLTSQGIEMIGPWYRFDQRNRVLERSSVEFSKWELFSEDFWNSGIEIEWKKVKNQGRKKIEIFCWMPESSAI